MAAKKKAKAKKVVAKRKPAKKTKKTTRDLNAYT